MPIPASPHLARRTLLTAGGAAALGLGASARAQPGQKTEVVHWWASGSESEAIRTVRRRIEAGGRSWVDTAVPGPDLAKTAAITRVLGGSPPTVMLWFVGKDLPDLYRDSVIRDVQAVAAAGNWDAVLPKPIADRLKVDGKYVAAPVDLHGGNWTFAHLPLLRAAGVAEVPATWPAVFEACEGLRRSGVIPVAFGGQAWQEASVFVHILAGTGGATLVQRFIADHDPQAAGGPEMVESFETFARLKPFVDKASPNRSSTDTAGLVAVGKAALLFSGDWSRGELNKAGLKPGVDYACRSAPGNDGIFLAVVDAFVMPRSADPAVLAAQDDFARVTMSPEVQHDFNLVKGSIPVRGDVELSGYDGCAQMAARLSRGGGQVLPSASMGMTTAMRAAFYDVVHRFWSTEGANPKTAARDLRTAIERNRT